MGSLSALDRKKNLEKLSSEVFDITIIGGGITGAGIALDAASRGLKVALVEKNDFASGTSSKSTKLIHGGLRYLKQFEINLVREVGRERAIVHRLAPHLVKSEKMLLPLVKGGTYGEWATSFGLWVYDILAGVQGEDKRRMLDKEETLAKEKMLRQDNLIGGGFYAEYRTDDARLTIENIKTAAQKGAISINYVLAEDFVYENNKINAICCKDLKTDTAFEIKTHYVVSAAGPWVDKLRKVDNSLHGKRLFLSKGVHIVVPHDRLPVQQAVYFDVSDGRMIFAIPRNRITYIGTTDTPYDGDINDIPVFEEDVTYLLDATNEMFPDANLTIQDVESSWAGLRPLIFEEGKSASEMSRKDEIFESETGLISIAGGKLTGFRKMAERIVDLVAEKAKKELKRKLSDNYTDKITLCGGPFKGEKEVYTYEQKVEKEIIALGLHPYFAKYLVSNYGKNAKLILEHMQEYNDDAEIALARAEAWYTIHHELASTLLDFFNRRTGRLYFDLPGIAKVKNAVINDFKLYFGWNKTQLSQETQALENAIKKATTFHSEGIENKKMSPA